MTFNILCCTNLKLTEMEIQTGWQKKARNKM